MLETLGCHCHVGPSVFSIGCENRRDDLVDEFMGVSHFLGCLTIGWPLRAEDLRSLMVMLTCLGPCLSSTARRERTLVHMLLGGKLDTRRCLEVSLGLLNSVHRCSIQEASNLPSSAGLPAPLQKYKML